MVAARGRTRASGKIVACSRYVNAVLDGLETTRGRSVERGRL